MIRPGAWRPWIAAVLVLLATGCAARQAVKETVENPYARQARVLTDAGLEAMRRERWDYAAGMFARALKAARLTADVRLAARAWYNLGAAHAAMGNNGEAAGDFRQARELALEVGDAAHALRSRLALALLPGADDWRAGKLPAGLPADVHLAAGRLAERHGDMDTAIEEYARALHQAGRARAGLRYRGEARLGLARLALAAGRGRQASRHARAAIGLFQKVGAPRLIAHALLLDARASVEPTHSLRQARRAWLIYQALEDMRGQRDALRLLAMRAGQMGNAEAARRWRARLREVTNAVRKHREQVGHGGATDRGKGGSTGSTR